MKGKVQNKSNKMEVQKLPTGIEGFDDEEDYQLLGVH